MVLKMLINGYIYLISYKLRYEIVIFVLSELKCLYWFFMYSPAAFARLRLPPLCAVERGIEGVSSW